MTKTRLGKPLLSRERIAHAALAYIDARGLEALSTRKLARELGCEAMTLYHHFPTKDALLDAVADLLVDEIHRGEAAEQTHRGEAAMQTKPPKRRHRSTFAAFVHEARALYDLAERHPNAFPLLALRRASTPASLRFYDRLIAPLLDAGLSPRDAALVFRMTGYYTLGAGLARIATRAQKVRPALDDFPTMAALGPHLSNVDDLYERGATLLAKAFENHFSGKLVKRP